MNRLRVLVAGHDPGGLNLLRPLLRSWSDGTSIVAQFLGDPSVSREIAEHVPHVVLAGTPFPLTDWTATRPDELDAYLDQLFAQSKFDAVLCSTSAHAILERRVLAAAKRSGVPSAAYCDMWWAYVDRFYDGAQWTLPDRLWVVDDEMGRQVEAEKWPRRLPIDVVGSTLFAERLTRTAAELSPEDKSIRFLSEPASTKFPEARVDEFSVADEVARVVAAYPVPRGLVVRPHPTDSMEAWRRWAYARRSLGVSLDWLPLEEAIAQTSHAIGLSSILLSEMSISGVRVASFRPIGASDSYFCLPFDELAIATVRNRRELAEWLNAGGAATGARSHLLHRGAIERATQMLVQLTRGDAP